MNETEYTAVCEVDELEEGGTKAIEIDGTPVLLCHTQDRIFAVINRCSHAEEKLECGRMKRGWIACPVHGARFDLESGEPLNPPATSPIRTFPVRVENGMIEVAL